MSKIKGRAEFQLRKRFIQKVQINEVNIERWNNFWVHKGSSDIDISEESLLPWKVESPKFSGVSSESTTL